MNRGILYTSHIKEVTKTYCSWSYGLFNNSFNVDTVTSIVGHAVTCKCSDGVFDLALYCIPVTRYSLNGACNWELLRENSLSLSEHVPKETLSAV